MNLLLILVITDSGIESAVWVFDLRVALFGSECCSLALKASTHRWLWAFATKTK